MRRWVVIVLVLLFSFCAESARAQRSGSGQFAGPNMCADVSGPVSGQTFCFDQTSGSLNVWNGSSYQLLTANLSTSANLNVATQLKNVGTGAHAAETIYLNNDIPHYAALQLSNTGFTDAGPLVAGDEMILGTNAANGVIFTSANATAAFNWAIGGLNLAYLNTSGLRFINNFTTGLEIAVQNTNTGTQGQANFEARSSDHSFQLGQLGSGWTANPFFAPDSSVIETDGPHLYIGSYVATTDLMFNITGSVFGRFINSYPQIQGLQLPGYASGTGLGNQTAGLSIGNSYFTATNWAGVSISGAAYYNQSTGQWVTDGGAGSGVGLINSYQGAHNFYYGAAAAAGNNVTWIQELGVDGNGEHVLHLDNLQAYGVLTVSSGTLTSGSRDTFGEVVGASSPLTLTFARAFTTSAYCIFSYGGGGPPQLWWATARSPSAITVQCQMPSGAACTAGGGLTYHCFGFGV